MLNKIRVEEAEKFSKIFGKDKYVTNHFYLAFNGFYETKNKELLLYERDELFQNDFPFIVFPQKEKNMIRAVATHCTKEEIERITSKKLQIRTMQAHGKEYYYKTKDLIEMKGKNFSSFRKQVHKFEKAQDYRILNDYSREKIISFIRYWEKGQKEKNDLFDLSLDYSIFCDENKDKIKGEWIFIEINDKLAGYSLSCKLNKNYWVGVHQKVNYSYRGLGKFLMHKRALMHSEIPYFTLGTEAKDKGIEIFKDSLHPFKKEERYFIITE
ncbi:MAG: phosphatidylglycerol lysyltransferase domain-containing protein [Nanoarchaeota archaeon]